MAVRSLAAIVLALTSWVSSAASDPAPDARFDFAVALSPFPYGAFEVGSTSITNWANDAPPLRLKEQAETLYGVDKQNKVSEEALPDGWLVRYTGSDGIVAGFVVRVILGMNLECKPSSFETDRVEMCRRMRAEGKKLVVPISLGKLRLVRLSRLIRDDRDLTRVTVTVRDATASDPKTIEAATGKILRREKMAGGFAVLVQGKETDGRARYDVIARMTIGASELTCTAREFERRLADIDLQLCLGMRRP